MSKTYTADLDDKVYYNFSKKALFKDTIGMIKLDKPGVWEHLPVDSRKEMLQRYLRCYPETFPYEAPAKQHMIERTVNSYAKRWQEMKNISTVNTNEQLINEVIQ